MCHAKLQIEQSPLNQILLMGFQKGIFISPIHMCHSQGKLRAEGKVFIVFGCYLEDNLKVSSTVTLRDYYEVKNVVILDQGLIKQRQTGKDFKESSK